MVVKVKNDNNILDKTVKINYDEDVETDTFDYFEDDDPFKNIKIT